MNWMLGCFTADVEANEDVSASSLCAEIVVGVHRFTRAQHCIARDAFSTQSPCAHVQHIVLVIEAGIQAP